MSDQEWLKYKYNIIYIGLLYKIQKLITLLGLLPACILPVYFIWYSDKIDSLF